MGALAANADDLHTELLAITDKQVGDLNDDEKMKIVKLLSNPTRDLYNLFHRSMKTETKQIPAAFKAEYERIIATKMERGVNTNKVADLQRMTKSWWLENKQQNSGRLQTILKWDSAFLVDVVYGVKSQKLEVSDNLHPWGIMVGKFGGEQLAVAALDRGEIQEREFTGKDGRKMTLFSVISVVRTPEYISRGRPNV